MKKLIILLLIAGCKSTNNSDFSNTLSNNAMDSSGVDYSVSTPESCLNQPSKDFEYKHKYSSMLQCFNSVRRSPITNLGQSLGWLNEEVGIAFASSLTDRSFTIVLPNDSYSFDIPTYLLTDLGNPPDYRPKEGIVFWRVITQIGAEDFLFDMWLDKKENFSLDNYKFSPTKHVNELVYSRSPRLENLPRKDISKACSYYNSRYIFNLYFSTLEKSKESIKDIQKLESVDKKACEDYLERKIYL